MRYPFTPALLDALPEGLAALFRSLEDTLLDEICSRLALADTLNEVTVQDIRALRSHGIPQEEIERAIRETAGIGEERLRALLDDVSAWNLRYYGILADAAQLTAPLFQVGTAEVDAIRRQTESEFRNLTRSLGFLVPQGGKKLMLPPAKAYQWALDNAEMQILSGAVNYNNAIAYAVRTLADSGIRTVAYAGGRTEHADVAVRRAVMTGISQICDKYTEDAAAELETTLFEVSAHMGARDTGKGWKNHKSWQGRVYSIRANDPDYPDIYAVCGLGTVDGLEGANCRHIRFPFIRGISQRAYTDKELEDIDPSPIIFEGQQYTAYEATQKQREVERTIRKAERQIVSCQAAGLTEDAQSAGIRLKRLRSKYRAFSKAAGLPEQWERTKVKIA